MKNSMIIKNSYYSGGNLPPQLNTPSALKDNRKKKLFRFCIIYKVLIMFM